MAQIIDQIVNISIQDAVSAVETTDVNTMAIVGKAGGGSSASAGVYADLDSIGEDFGTDSQLYGMAKNIYAQESMPDKLVVIPCASFTGLQDAIVAAAQAGLDFYHIVTFQDEATSAGLLSLQAWLSDNHKILHVQVPDASGLMAALKDMDVDRVAIYQHVEEVDDNPEYLAAALVALRCAADSARGTFAHKKVKGMTADSYTPTTYADAIAAGINIYTKVAGEKRVFMGTCANGPKTFIDNVIKDDWIRFNVQSKIFALLGEANDGAGVTYDDTGIQSVAAAIGNVFTQAAGSDRQYIMEGFEVEYKTYDYLKENNAEDVRKRNLPLISGRYSRMNSIHTVNTVKLNVTL